MYNVKFDRVGLSKKIHFDGVQCNSHCSKIKYDTKNCSESINIQVCTSGS